jgi:thiol-disulfide isomerase/thioredoxin
MNLQNAVNFLFALIFFTSVLNFGQTEHKTLEIGSKAPDFNLQGIDGKNYGLNSFSNAGVLVIIFTANHCPTAQAYEDRIIKLTNDYKDKGVAEKYGPQATPHVFIFDKDRVLRYTGRIDNSEKIRNVTENDARNAIDALLAGKVVSVKQTKTFGCSLKWAYKKESAKEAIEKWNKEKVELQTISLNEIKDLFKNNAENLRLINIWATWCGPCAAEFPDLIEINRMYRNREFEMITLSTDDISIKDKVLKFLEKKYASAKNYQYNSDDKYKLIDAVDKDWSGALPYTLLVRPGGEIIFKKEGMIDKLELKKAIVGYLGRYYK